ncbi:MAG: SdiA-regulated domain-containing protein, partial [Blastocatellia bacterium]|nr:SdiA-regulated domain-containing protein [Blastocatellia bacterium]
KAGQLIDSMTLAPGPSPQGTDFYDTEGVTYVGDGKFVLIEERDRQANLFTYVAGGILHKTDAQAVKLGTTVGNIGLEGISYDPLTGGFICVKEMDPQSIFQTGIDFAAGTATNGSPTATSSSDLFNPSLANLADFSDVFALSNLPSLNGQPDYSHLLILSQESGQIVNIDRSGTIYSTLTIVSDPGNPLSVADQTNEGLTMDRDGNLYVVNENGGGDSDHPQLWVYAPSTAPNQAPTAIMLSNAVTSIPENTSTASPVKLATIIVTDDGIGPNHLTVTGTDAGFFQIIGTALYLRAGTPLSSTAKPGYKVAVNVDDPTVGSTPDATTSYSLMVTAATGGTSSLIISEVAPWSSGNSSIGVDWFEVTNIGSASANIAGWKMDDDSRTFNNAVALNGVTTIAPGESVIFLETADLAATSAAFKTLWFGANPPANLQIGSYSGSGVGLSTGGDQVNLFDSAGTLQASVVFGPSPAGPFPSFDNAAGLNNTTISALSAAGVNGSFIAVNDAAEIGSPGTIGASATPIVNIMATDASATETGNDSGTFRISRTGSTVGS